MSTDSTSTVADPCAAGTAAASSSGARISSAWKQHGPLLRDSFLALGSSSTSDSSSSSPAPSSAATGAAASKLAVQLLTAHRSGCWRALQEELPLLLNSAGDPFETVALLLLKLPPRLPTPAKNNNSTPQKDSSSSTKEVSAPTATPTKYFPLPQELESSWYAQLISQTNFRFAGSSNHHSLQILLLTSLSSIINTNCDDRRIPSDSVKLMARNQLLPMWISTPSVFMHLLTVYEFAPALTCREHHYYFDAVRSCNHSSDAVDYLAHFNLLATCPVAPEELLIPLLQKGAGNAGEMQALEIGAKYEQFRVPLIRFLTTMSRKSTLSLRLINRYGLDIADFPEVERDQRFKQVKWLVREGKGEELGEEVCAGDAEMQRALVYEMIECNQLADVELVIRQFHLEADEDISRVLTERKAYVAVNPNAQVIGPQSSALGVEYLSLPPGVSVSMVSSDDASSLLAAKLGLSRDQTNMVGLDVEFGFVGSTTNQPALLQIATSKAVFLFDMITFNQDEPSIVADNVAPTMNSILYTLFHDESIMKVGYAWDGDWKILHQGFPRAACFSFQTNVLDLADPARAMDKATQMRKREEEKKLGIVSASSAVAPQQVIFDSPEGTEPASVSAEVLESSPEDATMEAADDDTNDNDTVAEDEAAGGEDAADRVNTSSSAASAASSTPSSTPLSAAAAARLERRKNKKLLKRGRTSTGTPSSAAGSPPVPIEDTTPKGVAMGLSALAALCCSKPLNKHYQISAWRRRPLKPAQIHYAALDAYCALDIFKAFFDPEKKLPQIAELALPPLESFVFHATAPTASVSSASSPSN